MPAPRGDKWETDMVRRVAQLEQRRPLANTGLSAPAPGVVQADGELVVNGPIDVHGDANFDGNTTIGGSAAITGTLSLPAGIINNDALAQPVKPAGVWESAANFTVSPTWTTVISKDVTVPAGFTTAVVVADGRVTAFLNQDTVDNVDYLYANLWVGSASSDYYPLVVTDNGGSGTNRVFRHAILSGLTPGGTLNFSLQISSDFETWASPSSPGNVAKLGATIMWLR